MVWKKGNVNALERMAYLQNPSYSLPASPPLRPECVTEIKSILIKVLNLTQWWQPHTPPKSPVLITDLIDFMVAVLLNPIKHDWGPYSSCWVLCRLPTNILPAARRWDVFRTCDGFTFISLCWAIYVATELFHELRSTEISGITDFPRFPFEMRTRSTAIYGRLKI